MAKIKWWNKPITWGAYAVCCLFALAIGLAELVGLGLLGLREEKKWRDAATENGRLAAEKT